MKRFLQGCGVALAGLAIAALPKLAWSADANDGSYVEGDPTYDIADFYNWVDPSTNQVVFVLDVFSGAPDNSTFNPKAQYAIHTTSLASYGATGGTDETIIATFSTSGAITLWVGSDELVTGDANTETGLSSADGKVKVFAGPRQDPFFFNAKGFKNATTTYARANAASPFSLDTGGCPALDASIATELVTDLRTVPIPEAGVVDGGPDGGPIDAFANVRVLSIVISVDKSLVTKGGPILASWASTHTAGS